MEVSFEIRVALPTGKQREIIGRIIGDLERFVSRNPQYRPNDVAVVMTTGLLQQISPVGCNLSHEARIMDHRVRIMDGDGLEWYITAIHGYILDSGYITPDPETVVLPEEVQDGSSR